MRVFVSNKSTLEEVESTTFFQELPAEKAIWIDLISPSKEEIQTVENYLSAKIPTKEEMKEIESSSRLYAESNALFMTINAVKKENGNYSVTNATFILKGHIVVTIRYEEIQPLTMFLKNATLKPIFPVDNSVSLLLGMMEGFIEKIADILEAISTHIELLSEKIFVDKAKKTIDLNKILINMGLQEDINAKTRDSLSTITRMIGFLKFHISKEDSISFANRLETLTLDASDLKDHSTFLGHKTAFLLDACLGLINIDQNHIIKIFSIAAVVLLPPTLVASVYGMNFDFIPELRWKFGYPLSLILMLLSAILPYLYIRKKGWL